MEIRSFHKITAYVITSTFLGYNLKNFVASTSRTEKYGIKISTKIYKSPITGNSGHLDFSHLEFLKMSQDEK
jgi:hypothetical protein